MFLVGLTLSALTVSTSDASFAGYVAKSVKLSQAILMLKFIHLAFGFTHELIILALIFDDDHAIVDLRAVERSGAVKSTK